MTKNSLLLIFIFFFSFHSWAEEKKPTTPPANKRNKKVMLTFEDELVKGSTEKPDLSNFDTKKDFNYKKLIRVRENFLNEMEGGLDDFKGN